MRFFFTLLVLTSFLSGCAVSGLVRDEKLNADLTRSVVHETADVRNLPLVRSLPVELIKPKQARQALLRQASAELSDEALAAYSSLLRKLKLVPFDFDAAAFMAEKLETGVGGYYDLDSNTMRLVHAKGGMGLVYRIGKRFVQRDLAGELLLSHEVAHALADQHFDLRHFLQAPATAPTNTDALLAKRAFVEGDAMLTGLWFTMGKRLRPVTYDPMSTSMSGENDEAERGIFDQVNAFFEIPPVIRRPLLFLYFDGLVFAGKRYEMGGTKALDTVYRRPPRSTEEILHPEKYRDQNDPPVTVRLGAPPAEMQGATLIAEDTIGEIGILSMLLEAACGGASNAAAGWGGDRYRLFQFAGEKDIVGKDKVGFEWKTVWDSEADAIEFSEAFTALLTDAFGEPVRPGRWETDRDAIRFGATGTRETAFLLSPIL